MPSVPLPWIVLSLAVVAVGAWLLYRGLSLWKQRRLMGVTTTTDVWHLDLGPAEINGTAKPVEGETLRAPFTDEPCLAAEWKIEEWNESGKHSSWHTEGSGTVSVSAFVVEDETGAVLSDPTVPRSTSTNSARRPSRLAARTTRRNRYGSFSRPTRRRARRTNRSSSRSTWDSRRATAGTTSTS
jgi:hypothetical protein